MTFEPLASASSSPPVGGPSDGRDSERATSNGRSERPDSTAERSVGKGDRGANSRGLAEPSHDPGSGNEGPDRARSLFRYVAADAWREYRAILGMFAGTFFAEFTPEEIAAEPAVMRAGVDPATVPDRLESLRRWGNLTVSSSVGNPSSIEDYYRRRNRYLITRSGQEVFQLVEGVLAAVDEIVDVQAGRLRDLHRALHTLGERAEDFAPISAEDLSSAVRTVFDLHERFTTELTQFFADLNQWQSRYDLNPDEVQLFAGILVSYVSEQLSEIERMTRPIARSLKAVLPRLDTLLGALRPSLAVRVDEAGLGGDVAVRRLPGTAAKDWEHLAEWFIAPPGQTSRLDRLTRQAVGAVRTLTANVTRLSRVGLGAASKRADYLRLAGFFDSAATRAEAHDIATAAFGLGSSRRLGTLSADADDPEPTTTAWRDAPGAIVPVSLRDRGDIIQRGRATPIRDRRRERELMHRDRELERVAREDTAAELLSCADDRGHIDGAEMSVASFSMLRDLVSRSGHNHAAGARVRTTTEFGVRCTVTRADGASTAVECPEGRLLMHGAVVSVIRDEKDLGPSGNGTTDDLTSAPAHPAGSRVSAQAPAGEPPTDGPEAMNGTAITSEAVSPADLLAADASEPAEGTAAADERAAALDAAVTGATA